MGNHRVEAVAKLLGWKQDAYHELWIDPNRSIGDDSGVCQVPPAYGTDANATRELLAYVEEQGRHTEFVDAMSMAFYGHRHRFCDALNEIGMMQWLNATPQQIYAAFCATFARELSELEKQS